jgi:acetyl esterase/lipase
MDALAQIQGSELPEISPPTYSYFIPLLLKNPSILSASPTTHQYGPYGSQTLDIYNPPPGTKPAGNSSKPPLVVFYYGGGYMSGRAQMSMSPVAGNVYIPDLPDTYIGADESRSQDDSKIKPIDKLYHQNIGTFIASYGFTVVIPNYRLIPSSALDLSRASEPYARNPETDALFPSGAEDVYTSLQWCTTSPLLAQTSNTSQIYAFGHSAGANHLATACLLPQFLPSSPALLARVRKISTLSATFSYVHSRESRKLAWSRYFGSFELIPERCPLGLVRTLGEAGAEPLPELYCAYAKRDHTGAKEPQSVFWGMWKDKGGRGRLVQVKGEEHNHMSTIYGVGCGDGEVEAWLVDLLGWFLDGKGEDGEDEK